MHLARAAVGGLAIATTLACGGMFSDPEDFTATVDAPPLVQKGEPFTVSITVHNTADQPQVLHSLDISDDWLAGVTLTGSEPPYTGAMHVPIDDTWSYEYMTEIPAGGSTVVTLHGTGTQVGPWLGSVDVCVGGMARFRTYPLVTTVE